MKKQIIEEELKKCTFKPLTNSLYNSRSNSRYTSPLDPERGDLPSKNISTTNNTNTTKNPNSNTISKHTHIYVPKPQTSLIASLVPIPSESLRICKRNFEKYIQEKFPTATDEEDGSPAAQAAPGR